MAEAPADKSRVHDADGSSQRPVRLPRRFLRLMACMGNAAVWMLACKALQIGTPATIVAGIFGFMTVVMVFGITRHSHE